MRHTPRLFRTFFQGGFECATHRRNDRARLDIIAATRHDTLAAADYRQLAAHGIRTVRDGIRWHLVEAAGPARYDWSSALPMLRAAHAAGTQVIWDLCHYGWPDWLDVWSPDFPRRFADYAHAFAGLFKAETGETPFLCPVNEISFLAWNGGDKGHVNPYALDRGWGLKRQLAAAAIAGTRAARAAVPETRFLTVEPIINIVPRPGHPEDPAECERLAGGQWEAWDMLAGTRDPELGGSPDLLDIVGVNFYWNNQWLHHGMPLSTYDERWIPLRHLLRTVHARYRRPILLAETSCEGDRRAPWFRHVAEEVAAAIESGVAMEGLCLYPVLSHLGWDNDRYCPNGLLELEPAGTRHTGQRPVHAPLAAALRQQQASFAPLLERRLDRAG